jgi:hypothetical protein
LCICGGIIIRPAALCAPSARKLAGLFRFEIDRPKMSPEALQHKNQAY